MKEKIDRVKETLGKIVSLFESGRIPKAIAVSTFPMFDAPCDKWSLLNRMILFANDTCDARGFRQWEKEERRVIKGSKAIYIMAPKILKAKKKETDENGEEKESTFCAGFRAVPVFPVEQTEGKELEYQKHRLPELPFKKKAEEWGIEVKSIPFEGFFLGMYSVCKEDGKEKIELCTDSEKTFFHELSHSAHRRVLGSLKGGQDPRQEIVAELAAQALCIISGKQMSSTLGNSYQYIAKYAMEQGKDPVRACLEVIKETEQVLRLILD